jgi:hypothetical protein
LFSVFSDVTFRYSVYGRCEEKYTFSIEKVFCISIRKNMLTFLESPAKRGHPGFSGGVLLDMLPEVLLLVVVASAGFLTLEVHNQCVDVLPGQYAEKLIQVIEQQATADVKQRCTLLTSRGFDHEADNARISLVSHFFSIAPSMFSEDIDDGLKLSLFCLVQLQKAEMGHIIRLAHQVLTVSVSLSHLPLLASANSREVIGNVVY